MAEPGIVSGSEVDTPAASPHVDGSVFRNAALSRGRSFTQGAEAVGDFFENVSQKFQQNKNAQTMLNADLSMRKFADDYRDSLAKNPDESTWVNNFQEQSNQLKDSILDGPNVGPDVKRQLQANLSTWQQAHTSEITTAAQLKSLNRTQEVATDSAYKAASQGDMQGAENNLRVAYNAGAWTKEDFDRKLASLQPVADKASIAHSIGADAYRTLEDLKDQDKDGRSKRWKSLDPEQVQSEMVKAQTQVDKNYKAGYEKVRDQQNQNYIYTKAELQDLADKHEIKASSIGSILKLQAGQSKVEDLPVNASKVQDMVLDLPDGMDESQRLARVVKIQSSKEYNLLTEPLKKTFDDALKAQNPKTDSSVEKDTLLRMKEDREKNGLTLPMAYETEDASKGLLGFGAHPASVKYHHVAGGLGALRKMDDEDVKAAFGPDATVEKVEKAEEQHYAQQQAKMKDWFASEEKAGRKPTNDDAEAYRQTIERPYITAAASAALTKNHPTLVGSEDEYESLPSGAPFVWNGRFGTKN